MTQEDLMVSVKNGLPDWKDRSENPPAEGCYIAEWDTGDIEPAWYVEYPGKGVFQRKCGTEEGGEGWDGCVGRVLRWCPVYVPVRAS